MIRCIKLNEEEKDIFDSLEKGDCHPKKEIERN